jgi:hypothetical protein
MKYLLTPKCPSYDDIVLKPNRQVPSFPELAAPRWRADVNIVCSVHR